MNKYRKAESRAIKRYMLAFRRLGYDAAYKQMRRRLRLMSRVVAKWLSRQTPICHEIRPLVSNNPSHDGFRADFVAIDEVSTDPEFVRKCAGKWYYKEENENGESKNL